MTVRGTGGVADWVTNLKNKERTSLKAGLEVHQGMVKNDLCPYKKAHSMRSTGIGGTSIDQALFGTPVETFLFVPKVHIFN